MALGKTALLFSFSIIGFLVGTSTYFIFNWIVTNGWIGILYIPIPISTPWVISGLAGSLLSVIAVSIAAHYSSES